MFYIVRIHVFSFYDKKCLSEKTDNIIILNQKQVLSGNGLKNISTTQWHMSFKYTCLFLDHFDNNS